MSKTLVLAGFLALSMQAALAQQQDSLRTEETLREVVITASKVPLTQRETAKPVQVIRREEIDRSAGKDLSQLLNEKIGVHLSGAYSSPVQPKTLFIRGASSQYALILIDGVPLNDASGAGEAFDLRMLPLHQIERIEILKGSQSTLYGSDAIAGVINIITRSAGDRRVAVNGLASAGSFNTLEGALGVNGTAGVFNYSLGYSRMETDGFSDALDKDENFEFDKDGARRESFQGKVGVNINQAFRLTPFLRYNEFEGAFDADAFTDAKHSSTSYLLNPGLSASFEKGRFSLTSLYNYLQYDRSFRYSWDTLQYRGRTQNADVFASYKLHSNLQFLMGFYYQSAKMLDTLGVKKNPLYETFSPYATVILKDLKGLSLEAGYRLNHHSQFGNHSTFSQALSYQISDAVQIFASAATGYKSPVLSQLYGRWGPNPELEPQTSITLEGGVALYLLQEKLQARATYFDREINNLIYYDAKLGYINQDRQKDHGVEVEVEFRPNQQWQFSAGYTYLDGAFTTSLGVDKDTTYNNLIRRPRHSVKAGVGVNPLQNLYLSVNTQHFGERMDYFFNPTTYARENVELKAYVLLNAYAEYKLLRNRLAIFADVKNLTDADFTEVYGYSTPGINLQSGIRFQF